ncbi:MAG: SPFH domain-containing protein [Thermoproteota archaeon]|jgi:SPFH domain, Band 7 family protein
MDLATTIAISILVLIIAIIFLSGIRIFKEWERAPYLVLGRFRGFKGPGITYIIPIIGRTPFVISTRLQTQAFKTEQTLTKDNVPVNVDAVMYYQPVDLTKVVLNVENYILSTQLAAQTTLREVIGGVTLDELLAEREKIGAQARAIIDQKTETWGIKVTAVEIRDIIIPTTLQEAMARQAAAERERRARVTLAMAEYEAASKMIEAASLYEKSQYGLQLRWMNILYELGLQGRGTLMLIPANMMTVGPGIPSMGLVSVSDLTGAAKQQQKKEEKS